MLQVLLNRGTMLQFQRQWDRRRRRHRRRNGEGVKGMRWKSVRGRIREYLARLQRDVYPRKAKEAEEAEKAEKAAKAAAKDKAKAAREVREKEARAPPVKEEPREARREEEAPESASVGGPSPTASSSLGATSAVGATSAGGSPSATEPSSRFSAASPGDTSPVTLDSMDADLPLAATT